MKNLSRNIAVLCPDLRVTACSIAEHPTDSTFLCLCQTDTRHTIHEVTLLCVINAMYSADFPFPQS